MFRQTGLLVLLCSFSLPGIACDDARDATLNPERLVIAGGSITEIVYDLGVEAHIVGVDRTSNYPAAALDLPQVGYVRNLSAEGLLSLDPTLILGEDDMGPLEVVNQVRAAGVDIVRLPETYTVDGIIAKMLCVARLVSASEQAVAELRARLDAQAQRLVNVKRLDRPRVAVLLNLTDGVPTAGGADTSADGLLQMAGGENVFAQFHGWKPVSLESMATADPEFVVMPLRGLQAAGGVDAVLAHPALRMTSAGRNRAVIAIDGMAMLGFGPRTIGVAVALAESFETLEVAQGG